MFLFCLCCCLLLFVLLNVLYFLCEFSVCIVFGCYVFWCLCCVCLLTFFRIVSFLLFYVCVVLVFIFSFFNVALVFFDMFRCCFILFCCFISVSVFCCLWVRFILLCFYLFFWCFWLLLFVSLCCCLFLMLFFISCLCVCDCFFFSILFFLNSDTPRQKWLGARTSPEMARGTHLARSGLGHASRQKWLGAPVRFCDPGFLFWSWPVNAFRSVPSVCSGPGLWKRSVPFRRYVPVPFVLPSWSWSWPWSCLVSCSCFFRELSSVCRLFFCFGTRPGASPGWSALSVPFRSVMFCLLAACPSVLALVPFPSVLVVVVRFAGFLWKFCFSCFLLRCTEQPMFPSID